MATLRFDFSAAREPALALRIANLVTQDIERLEKQVFNTSTNWQRLEKPFKAHYAIQLVNRIGNAPVRDLMLAALPSYEANAARYKKDSKRRGRPLTEYIHEKASDMPTIQANTTTQDNAPEQDMDAAIDAILNDGDALNGPSPADRMREAMAQAQAARDAAKQAQQEQGEQGEGDAASSADDTAGEGEGKDSEGEQGKSESQDDPLRAAVQAMMDAMNVQQKDGQQQAQPSMDEDRVREIAREEDAVVIAAVDSVVRDAIKQAAGIRVVEVKRTETNGEVTTLNLGVQHKQFDKLVKLCGVRNDDGYQWPVWLPGPAGSGKTTAARNVAKALDLPFYFTGAVDQPYGLIGFRDAGGNYNRTSFREAFENGGVFLWDEVDASNPNALTIFNAAFENGVCPFPDGIVQRHPDCILIAAANTYGHGATHEYVGRNKLDAASVDRFLMLDWTYDEALELALAGDNEWTRYVQKARKACASAGIKHVISPRASIRGNKLLAEGFEKDEVIRMTVRKGLPDDSWKTITSRM